MRVFRRLAILVPVAGALYFGGYVFLPYYSVGPGPARDVEPLIRVDGATRYPSEGRFVLTSVVFRQLTGFGVVGAWLDPDRAVVAREQVYPSGEPVEVERVRSISQMDQSKLDATYIVLRELTDYPKDHGEGVLVEGVVGGCAADGELYPGDLIQRIDDEPVDTVRAASRAIGSAESGSTLTFDVTVDGEPETVRLVREPCGGAEDPLVGVSLINSFPIDVRISSGAIGGPSAGLMWALGLYDLLTPGDLTGGRTVAGTGVIGTDGAVLPIGGIGEKLTAADDAGADVFLVPKDNLEEARAAGDHGLELVVVATFDDAIAYLASGP
ncbi:MAG: YlbL family protein [Actinomycetota bacterium]